VDAQGFEYREGGKPFFNELPAVNLQESGGAAEKCIDGGEVGAQQAEFPKYGEDFRIVSG